MPDVPLERHPAVEVARYRLATEHDAGGIATLHAESWRRHYRGAYLDSYLDGPVVDERRKVWASRLDAFSPDQCTVVADRFGDVVGFAHTVLDEDPKWGALLENLHVRNDLKGRGIGTRLLSEVALRLLGLHPSGSLHLWVLDQNRPAQRFYEARGGTRVESGVRGPFPGGGTAMGHRYYWKDISLLVESGT
ncbi:MAG: N-acetyltransferase family protein [Acidimicrobiales bacterium]